MSLQMQTPQRPLPGAYYATPVASQYQGASSSRVQTGPQRTSPQNAVAQNSTATTSGQATTRSPEESLSPVERAARTINDTLAQELKYPELDNYVPQGISADYDLTSTAAWAPFQKGKVFKIPDKIFEQLNRGQLMTDLGLFADINHAYVVIDNAVYLWEYTHPDPPLVGFEEQRNAITKVMMVVPREGVFVKSITRLLVIATLYEIILVGVELEKSGGSYSISLYQTKMSVPVRGLTVRCLAGSADGRIFFTGSVDNDVYELTYQQEERWFFSRCQKINHTRTRLSAITPSLSFTGRAPAEHTEQLVVDSSRELLYTLSTESSIRVFHMKSKTTLKLTATKRRTDILNHVSHMTSHAGQIIGQPRISSIHPIPAQEASRLHLMATTETGCRLFLSATQSFGYLSTDAYGGTMSMQVHHIKFAPSDGSPVAASGISATSANAPQLNTSSRALTNSHKAWRFGPGFFIDNVRKHGQPGVDDLFFSGPDSGRVIRPQEPLAPHKYPELAMWARLDAPIEDVSLITEPFSAAPTPLGFANELAVQFDKPTTEIAIMTSTGIHTFRRQRLVDMFVSALRVSRGEEGLTGIVNKFIRQYGRSETAATALAVACGQGIEITSDGRSVAVTDPGVVNSAKTAFIEHGGKPHLNENAMVDQATPPTDMVVPSPRHDGLALYVSRLVRSFWKSPVISETATPIGGLSVSCTFSLEKLQNVQQCLSDLRDFLDSNKTFIDGLAGPEALGRVSTRQQEIALQAEHRALHALLTLISSIVEGISFVQMLFSERMEDIVLSLTPETRDNVRKLTFEALFAGTKGKDIAKELVKAIVNRNIINGANVETVADALRRRCGSFCSPADVIIFRAQEQLRRASDSGSGSEIGRNLLNESLKLFKEAAPQLSLEQLETAMKQYTAMQFFAGAIDLALQVAQESDRGNRALIWIQNGRPAGDSGEAIFTKRRNCYDLIHEVITALEITIQRTTDINDADSSLATTRRQEAYAIIDTSDDEVFQTDLYDWYIDQGQADRLLVIQSPYVVTYLERRFEHNITIANLLWRYHSQAGNPMRAASVQMELAKSAYPLSLNERIEYLGRARANASASSFTAGRQQRQQLLHDISERLDIAGIQDDLLQKLREDERLQPERRAEVVRLLDGQIQPVSVLYNDFVDQAGYHDLALLIYQLANHRNPIDIRDTWRNLIDQVHTKAADSGRQPYEAVANTVRSLGNRLHQSESTFPIPELMSILKRYAYTHQRGVGPPTWVVDVFIDLQVPYESIFSNLEFLLYNQEQPFVSGNRHYIADDMLYVAEKRYRETARGLNALFGGDANAAAMVGTLGNLVDLGLSEGKREDCMALRARIDALLR